MSSLGAKAVLEVCTGARPRRTLGELSEHPTWQAVSCSHERRRGPHLRSDRLKDSVFSVTRFSERHSVENYDCSLGRHVALRLRWGPAFPEGCGWVRSRTFEANRLEHFFSPLPRSLGVAPVRKTCSRPLGAGLHRDGQRGPGMLTAPTSRGAWRVAPSAWRLGPGRRAHVGGRRVVGKRRVGERGSLCESTSAAI